MSDYPLFPFIQFYVIATITYLLVQLCMAFANWRAQIIQEPEHTRIVDELIRKGRFPRVSVIFPIYNEDPDVLAVIMEHATACLSIPGLELIFVDDGSRNRAELEPIYQRFERAYGPKRLRVLREPENRGKRMALYRGFQVAKGKYFITADSDTHIYPEGVMRLVAPIIADPRIGAVTGDVQVENINDTWLTHLIGLRYWVSFHVERGAQSLSGSMMVCSGPFSVYRADVIKRVREAFISQTFLGQPCVYGDDRHLTWLILKEGYLTRIQEGAVARTLAPRTIADYVPQQVRWTKSFIRELFWVLPGFRRISLYSLLDTIYQPVISFCFMFAMSNVMFLFFETLNPFLLIGEFIILLMMASLRGLYGFLRTRERHFVRFPLYGLIHVGIILPLRWKALFTLADTGWGTRERSKSNTYRAFLWWQVFFLGAMTALGLTAAIITPDEATAGIKAMGGLSVVEMAQRFAGTVVHWWSRGLLVASVLSLVFLIVGLRRIERKILTPKTLLRLVTVSGQADFGDDAVGERAA